MKSDLTCTDAVLTTLEQQEWTTYAELCANVARISRFDKSTVRKVLWTLIHQGSVQSEKISPRYSRYALIDDSRHVQTVDADHFTVPPELLGTPLSPMAWSMRHLLGA